MPYRMKMKRIICAVLTAFLVLTAGCGGKRTISNSEADPYTPEATTEVHYEEVEAFYGESASYGNMTVTVDKVEDPNITMENTGKKLLFFHVKIQNGTDDAVTTNYLNNFALTVDGTFFEPDECFTIPAGAQLYKFYGQESFSDEIAAGAEYTGYLAAEVNPGFEAIQLHYIPKTTDRGSRISVSLTKNDVTQAATEAAES